MKKILVFLAIIIIAFGGWYIWRGRTTVNTRTVTFFCDANKNITAIFDLSLNGGVSLALSDGRKLSLPHAVSANGARYANADESIVFWNVGTTAFMTEGSGTTYADCNEQGITNNVSVAGGTVSNSGVVSTYTNTQYGFTLTYPQGLTATATFDQFYNLNNWWRSQAGPDATGTAVVMIPVFRVDHGGVATGQPYPLFFAAETRVGVSSDSVQVAQCEKPDPGYTKEPETDVTMVGTVWKKYTFQDAGMMKYLQGVSYRTVHNGSCYVIEAIKTGSSYKDDTMTAGIPDATLDSYFTEAQNIALGFTFTK